MNPQEKYDFFFKSNVTPEELIDQMIKHKGEIMGSKIEIFEKDEYGNEPPLEKAGEIIDITKISDRNSQEPWLSVKIRFLDNKEDEGRYEISSLETKLTESSIALENKGDHFLTGRYIRRFTILF